MNMLIYDLVGDFCLSGLLGDVCNINYSDTLFTCRQTVHGAGEMIRVKEESREFIVSS